MSGSHATGSVQGPGRYVRVASLTGHPVGMKNVAGLFSGGGRAGSRGKAPIKPLGASVVISPLLCFCSVTSIQVGRYRHVRLGGVASEARYTLVQCGVRL